MRHLFSSKVKVTRVMPTYVNGSQVNTWQQITDDVDPYCDPGEAWVRIDLGYLRPGRETLLPTEQGVFPDRVGVVFMEYSPNVNLGDRLVTIYGPIEGTFEVMNKPDVLQDFRNVHHMEISIKETAQSNTGHYELPIEG